MISYKILQELEACILGLELFEDNFDIRKEYTIEEALEIVKDKQIYVDYYDIKWLIIKCPYCQTVEMIKYYKSLNPNHCNVSDLIYYCKYCQSKEIKELLLEGFNIKLKGVK